MAKQQAIRPAREAMENSYESKHLTSAFTRNKYISFDQTFFMVWNFYTLKSCSDAL